MTSFLNGTASIADGSVFDEGTENTDCIISQELATFNDPSNRIYMSSKAVEKMVNASASTNGTIVSGC